MAIKNIYDTEISAPSFTWNGNTIATQAWVNANVGTPTLDAVTTVGNTTTNSIEVGPAFFVGRNISTTSAYAQLGHGRTGSGYAYIDLVGDTTYTDYGLRVIRYNTGANAASDIAHRGTGQFSIISNEAAPILFKTTAAERMRILPAGQVAIGRTTAFTVGGTATLSVNGDIISWGNSSTDLSYFRRLSTGNFQWQTYNGANAGNIHLQPYGGEVGIGTTSPKSTVHVDGVLTLEGGSRSNPSAGINEAVVIDYQLSGTSLGRLRSRDWDLGVWKDFIIQANDITLDADGILDIQSSAYFSGSTNSGRLYADDWGLKVGTSSGHIQFGPANTSWAHIYTDRPAFYFNKELYVNNAQVATRSWVTGQNYLTSYTETDTLATVVARGAYFGTTNQGYVASGGTYGTELRKIRRITLTSGASNWDGDNHAILSEDISGATTDSISINSYNGIHLRLDTNNNQANNLTNFTIHNNTTTNTNELFRVTGDGNVGIGTTSPATKLQVDGTLLLGDSYVQPAGSSWTTSNSQLILGGAHNLGFNTGTKAKLVISGYDNDGSTIYPIFVEDENGYADFWVKNRPSAAGASTAFFSGNVGIGTTSPGYTLDVNGSMHSTNITIADGIYHEGDTNTYMQFPANDTWRVVTSASERLRVTSTGNVGIGASSPSTKLQVGTGSVDDRVRVYYSDGTYSEQTGWGMEFARNASYLRPNNNNARTLNIGSSGLAWNAVNVESTNFTWNSNAVATQSWVTSQGYGTVYTPDVYEWAGGVFNASGTPIDIAGQMVNGTTTSSQVSQSEIRFTAAGTYMISWSLNWESLYANRSVFGAGAYLNGFIIPGSSNLQYFRYNTYGHASTTNATFSVQVAANDVISWRTLLHSGAVSHATTPIGGDMGVITIHRIA